MELDKTQQLLRDTVEHLLPYNSPVKHETLVMYWYIC